MKILSPTRVLLAVVFLAAATDAMPVLDVSSAQFTFGTKPGASPPPQTFRIFNRGDGTLNPTASVPFAYSWLTVSISGNSGTIAISSNALATGMYNAAFTLNDPLAADSPRTISVTLYVTSTVVAIPAAISISVPANTAAYRDIYLPLSSVPTGNIPAWGASTSNGGNWLTTQLVADNGVYIRANIAPLPAGSYSGTVLFTLGGKNVGSVPVNVVSGAATTPSSPPPAPPPAAVSGAPAINFGGVVDAANYCGRTNCYLAPGSLATIFGTGLADSTASATAVPLPTQLATTQVLVNGTAAPLLYVSGSQVNFVLPNAPPSAARWIVTVTRDGQPSNVISAKYTTTAPSIFTADQSGAGYGAILLAGTSTLAGAGSPAARGSYVEIYGTGLGAASLPPPTVVFSGSGIMGNVEVAASYAGAAPGFAGLNQVNVQIPASLPATNHLRVQIRTPYNLLSNVVEIAVK